MNPLQSVPIPQGINAGLSSAKNSTMIQILGMPRDTMDNECRPVTNNPTKQLIVTEDVGPFRVTGLRPAVASLRGILSRIKDAEAEVFGLLSSAGMLCARLVAGSQSISNHSWGTAIDLRMGTVLDGIQTKAAKTDGKTLAGLAAIAPFFNQEGWFWGVAFGSFEDGMHFEVADETIRQWHAEGKLGENLTHRLVTAANLSIGDRGVEVRQLQEALLGLGVDIRPDGVFGPLTRAAVMNFQSGNGLDPDGIVGPLTMQKLHLA